MRRFGLGAMVAGGVASVAGMADAELVICNDGSVSRSVAIAYHDGAQWVSEGWWAIAPGACRTPIKEALSQRHYYIRATAPELEFSGEGYYFCTSAEAFTIAAADGACDAPGQTSSDFADIDTGTTGTDFTFRLRDAAAEPDTVRAGGGGDAGTASFPPGSHGEPYTVEALVQGCGPAAQVDGCSFYAEGARWIASRGAGSNEAALDAMAVMAVNTPLIVTGDMISFGDITVDAVVARIAPGNPDPFAAERALMQGDWVDTTDPAHRLRVRGSEEDALFRGELIATAVLSLADQCPGGEAGIGPVVIKQTMGADPADVQCLAIVNLEPQRMELSYVGRGNSLIFARP